MTGEAAFDAGREATRPRDAHAAGEAQLRALLAGLSDAVLVVGGDGLVRFENPAARALFGAPSSLVGRHFGLPVFDGVATDIDLLPAGGPPVVAETRVVGVEWDGAPALVVTLRDVTERRRQEGRWREREAWLRALVDNALDAILVADDAGRYVLANPAAAELLGTTPDDLLGRTVADFAPRDAPQGYRGEWSRFLADGRQEGAIRLCRLDGAERLVEYRARAHFAPGLHLSFMRDVTERTRLEQDLRQAQKMEAIGRLAGGVAHDFNNLLTAILGYATQILEDAPPGSSIADAAAEVKQAGERAAALTRQLLLFSRPQVIQIEALDLHEVVDGLANLLPRLLTTAIRVERRLDAARATVLADRVQLEQVLMNLAVNARDAMPHGGGLTIATRLVALPDGREAVELCVADTGVGMSPEVAARAFEPFFTTKQPGQGTGLGLATVYGIVRQLGGLARIESQPGAGTCVLITLPLTSEAMVPRPTPTGQPPGRGETVLVVEDEASVRRLTVALLRRAGYEVFEAADGPQALALVGAGIPVPELLLSDAVMPGLSGRALARQLREAHPRIKVLFMSGYADGVSEPRDAAEDAGHVLAKPFTAGELARRVREALDQG